MNEHVAAFVRLWWVASLGLAVAAIAGAAVIYEIHLGVPPTLEDRTPPSYAATTRLLLNTAENPIVRTGVPEATEETSGEPSGETSPPGVEILVDAANLLPLVIESDEVGDLRRRRVGRPRGTVTAQALYARPEDRPGLRPTAVPIIEVKAVSPTSAEAVRLVRGTVYGFEQWLIREQEEADVAPAQRIVVQPLYAAAQVTVESETSYGLALLVAGAVLAGSGLLITALHRAVPPRGREAALRSPSLEQTPSAASEVVAVEGGSNNRSHEGLPSDGEAGGAQRDRLRAWLEEPPPESQAKEPRTKAKRPAPGSAKRRAPGKSKAPRSKRS